MSFGIVIIGWVLLSWIVINLGIFENFLLCIFLNFFMIFCNDVDIKKYCWWSFNFLLLLVELLG